jgi:hypothetical protein
LKLKESYWAIYLDTIFKNKMSRKKQKCVGKSEMSGGKRNVWANKKCSEETIAIFSSDNT